MTIQELTSSPIFTWIITTTIPIIIGVMWRLSVKHRKDHQLLKMGLRTLLKSQILDIYNRATEKGRLGEHEKDMVNDLYSDYHYGLDGNGYIKTIVDKINSNY
jgi:hypothetical protein